MARLSSPALRVSAALFALAGLVAAGLFTMLLWTDPTFSKAPDLSPKALEDAGISFEQPYAQTPRSFRMRDGKRLASQYLKVEGAGSNAPTPVDTIVLVHGLLSSSFLMNRTSGMLRDATGAEVVAVDLRGHGSSEGRPGDVAYIGQYEDDLGDVIREIRAARPGGRVFLAGHSMGGGIALRYAQRAGLPPVDGYLLFAPYLGWESPTTRKEPAPGGADSDAGASFLKINLARILALKALNVVGISSFNGLRVQFFNLPPELPLRSYSYRAMENGAPADYRSALLAVRAPLFVLVGSRDEAFHADAYEGVIKASGKGSVLVVPDATHNRLVTDARTMDAVARWVAAS